MSEVRVLVVDDEEIAVRAHAAYVERLPGFVVAGTARSAADTMRVLRTEPVDMVLLDMNLPDAHGLELLHRMRAEGHVCDVVAVTAARDLEVVRRAVAQGVVLYLIKPFGFAAFRAKLEQYSAYLDSLRPRDQAVVQDDVDQILATLRAGESAPLPKGMSHDTLRLVTDVLRTAPAPRSAAETAAAVGASRVTVRRYLEHLAATGVAVRQARYGGGGRPEIEYAIRPGH